MIPILFNGTDTNFNTNGLGRMTDCLSCYVSEERNGAYVLEMVIATTSPVYSLLEVGSTVVVTVSDGTRQAFDIYEISRPINQRVTIKANHISYRLSYVPVKPFTADGITDTFTGLIDNSMESNPFIFTTDISNTQSVYQQTIPKSCRACLGGTQGSVLDVFSGRGSGEYLWDNFNVRFLLHRGQNRGVSFRYGKNITNFEYKQNMDEVVTGVLPYWASADGTMVFYGDIQYAGNRRNYPNPRTVVLDLSSEFEEAPSRSELNDAGFEYITNSSVSLPKDNITISFIDLAKTGEQAILEQVFLCDTVTVNYQPLDITYQSKVIKTSWNVLKERYEEIEIGQPKSNLSSTLAKDITDIAENISSNAMVSVIQQIDYDNGEIVEAIARVTERVEDVEEDVDDINNNKITTITENYNTIKQTVEGTEQTIGEVQRTVDGNTESITKLETYIHTGIDGITIGNNQSGITGHFGNSSLDFMDGDSRVAWVDGEEQTLGAKSVSLGSPDTVTNRWKLTVSDDGSHFRITRHN